MSVVMMVMTVAVMPVMPVVVMSVMAVVAVMMATMMAVPRSGLCFGGESSKGGNATQHSHNQEGSFQHD